jgi:hypothetical protein
MDQRRLKVGDIVDDYCPRERRVTDHAIVAMIDDTIRQTRCAACDNEHPYKEARAPRTRRKATPATLYQEVLSNVTDQAPAAPQQPVPPPAEPAVAASPADVTVDVPEVPEGHVAPEADEPEPKDEGPVHRPLIRATLPRPQGDTPAARPIPEFTIRQSGGRGRFRDDFRGNGFRAAGGRNGSQPGQGRPGRPGGASNQQPRGRHRGRPGPHKKRSR